MKVQVLFFATIRERAGTRQASMDLPEDCNVRRFKELLCDQFPALQERMPAAIVAVNKEFAFDDQLIPDMAEVAVFPPVSGG